MFSNSDLTTPSLAPKADDGCRDHGEIEILLPDSWNQPLWKRLLGQLRDAVSEEKLPALELTSRPVSLGMLLGDRISLPWYRTVFTNLGDVISPETVPPLELESRPIDVGELLSDQMRRPWWASLVRNLADQVAPERMPPLELTSLPMDANFASGSMLLPRWSSLISTPKVFLADKPKRDDNYELKLPKPAPSTVKRDGRDVEFIQAVEADLRRDLRRLAFRQRAWIALAALEIVVLFWTLFFSH